MYAISKLKGLSGVPSGFDKLDKLTSGWQPSDLIIIASRPGMGKTALSLSMARNMAITHNVPVAFFSLEMSDKYGIALITATHDNEFIKSFKNVYRLKDAILSKTDE